MGLHRGEPLQMYPSPAHRAARALSRELNGDGEQALAGPSDLGRWSTPSEDGGGIRTRVSPLSEEVSVACAPGGCGEDARPEGLAPQQNFRPALPGSRPAGR